MALSLANTGPDDNHSPVPLVPRLPDPSGHLPVPDRKRRYNRQLFDLIARRYDRFTRWFSFGMDGRWKRVLATEAAAVLPPGGVLLDLACGTGDLLEAVLGTGRRAGGPAMAVGLDLSVEMLRIARTRRSRAFPSSPVFSRPVPSSSVPSSSALSRLVRGDLSCLPFPSASADVITIGYGLRNAPSLPQTLREIVRVLRPGGWLFSLDFFLPSHRGWRATYLWYLRRAGRVVGYWWHGDAGAYGYIEASLRGWCIAEALSETLGGAGLDVQRVHRWLGGGMAVHVARRGG